MNYVNSITCSVSDNRNEFSLVFRQLRPLVSSDGKLSGNAEETISELVMNRDTAIALKTILDGALSAPPVVN